MLQHIGVLSLLYIALVVVTIRFMYTADSKTYITSKILTSFMFLIIGCAAFLQCRQNIYFAFLPAYIFCFLGDLFLGLSHGEDGKVKNPQFLLGLSAFGLAHVVYIIQFGRLLNGRLWPCWLIIGVIYVALVYFNRSNDGYKFGSNLQACIAYSFLIGTMANVGILIAVLNFGKLPYMLIGLAAIFFICSDTIIAHKYFAVKKRSWYAGAELALYYAAMLLLSTFQLFI